MGDEKFLVVADPSILMRQLIDSAEGDLERLQKEADKFQHLARTVCNCDFSHVKFWNTACNDRRIR